MMNDIHDLDDTIPYCTIAVQGLYKAYYNSNRVAYWFFITHYETLHLYMGKVITIVIQVKSLFMSHNVKTAWKYNKELLLIE